jgi:gliding motility-associated-like protein
LKKGQLQPVILVLFALFTQKVAAQFCNPIDTVVVIQDNFSTSIQITVDGVINNDLSHPLQGICAVQLEFEHTQVSDLTMTLNSPAGQQIELVGPYLVNFPTPFSSWSVVFTQCGFPAAPDPGFPATWNNQAPWAAFGNYNGTYYPSDGCLETFNTGPVNGTWTLNITDHIQFDQGELTGINLLFCDPGGIDCSLCIADAGEIILPDSLTFCQGDPALNLDWPDVLFDSLPDPDSYRYEFIRILNDTVHETLNPLDLSVLDTGSYTLCGLSFNRNDSLYYESILPGMPAHELNELVDDANSTFCADLTDRCIVIDILPNFSMLDTTVNLCPGDTVWFMGETYTEPGDYFLTDESFGPCGSTILLHLEYYDLDTRIISDGFVLSCSENTLQLEGQIISGYDDVRFSWETDGGSFIGGQDSLTVLVSQPGIYYFIAEKDNCPDTAFITVVSDGSLPEYFVSAGTISCLNPSVPIQLIPVSPVSAIQWTSPSNTVFFEEDPMVSEPGEYILELTGQNGCVSIGTVEVGVDTLRPEFSLSADTLTCEHPTTTLFLETESLITQVFWPELGTNDPAPVVSQPGLIHVQVTGLNGCTAFDSILIVSDFDIPEFSLGYDTISCYVDSVTIDLNSPDTDLDYLWTDPAGNTFTTEDITITTGGWYQLQVINSAKCRVDTLFEVIENTHIPNFNIPDTLVIPCDEDFIELIPVINSPYDSLRWSGPGSFTSTFPTPFTSVTGTYFLEVTGTNGCVGMDTMVVASPPEIPEITVLTDTINCDTPVGNLSLLYSGNLSFAWEDSEGNLFTGTTVSSSVPMEYMLTVTDNDFNCTSERVVSLPLDTLPPEIIIQPADTITCIHPESLLSVVTNGPVKTIRWFGNGLDIMGNNIPVNQGGWYTTEVTGTNGCMATDSIEIRESDSFIGQPDTFFIDCLVDSVQISIPWIPVDSYLWSLNGTFLSNEESPFVFDEGTYKVVVSTLEGCIDSTLVTVLYDQDLPEFKLNILGEINCVDTSVTLHAQPLSNLVDYVWTGPGIYSESLSIVTELEGTYYFHATGENLCDRTDSLTVVASREFPEISALGDAVNCFDQQKDLMITGMIEGSYSGIQWTGPDFYSSSSLENIVQDTGMYILRVEGSKGCFSYDTAYIRIDTLPPDFFFIRPDTITCFSGTSELNINTDDGILSVLWTGNEGYSSTNLPAIVDQAGSYWIQVTGTNGCISTGTVNVPQNKLIPYISLNTLDISCNRVKVPLELTTSAGAFFAEWSGPNNYSYTGPEPAVRDTGMYYLLLTDLDNGCQNTDSIRVRADLVPPELETADARLGCNGNPVVLELTSNPEQVTYHWEGPGGFASFSGQPQTILPGTYYVTVTRIDNGCSASDSLQVIDEPEYPDIALTLQPMNCISDSAILQLDMTEVPDSIHWSGPVDFESTGASIVIYEPGTYYLEVFGNNGCISDSLITVVPDTLSPLASIVYDDFMVCEKNTARLDGSGSSNGPEFSYLWQSDEGMIVSGKYSLSPLIEGEGIYTLSVLNEVNGCLSIDTLMVEKQPSPLESLVLYIQPPACRGYADGRIGVEAVLTGADPVRFSLNGSAYSANPAFTDLVAGNYLLNVRDALGCELDTMINLPDGGLLNVRIEADRTQIQLGESVFLTGVISSDLPVASLIWSPEDLIETPGQPEVQVSPSLTTEFTLTVYDELGCEARDRITIFVVEKPEVNVPNVFTPNGDNINDRFRVTAGSGVERIELIEIFDRWGNKLYRGRFPETIDEENGWDGTFMGKSVNPGVYIYHLEVLLHNGQTVQFAGDLTLIR